MFPFQVVIRKVQSCTQSNAFAQATFVTGFGEIRSLIDFFNNNKGNWTVLNRYKKIYGREP